VKDGANGIISGSGAEGARAGGTPFARRQGSTTDPSSRAGSNRPRFKEKIEEAFGRSSRARRGPNHVETDCGAVIPQGPVLSWERHGKRRNEPLGPASGVTRGGQQDRD